MNLDKTTTVIGAVAAVSQACAQLGLAQEYSGLVSAVSVALLGYYSNKSRA